MKNKKLRRLAAAIAACAVMISAVPAVPASAAVGDNLIKNSTFDTGTSGWAIYKESGGVCSLGTEDGKLAMHVEKQGTLAYACQLNYDIIPLYQNGVYRLSFEISSSIPRVVEAMIQLNGGDYHSYTWKKIEVTEEPQKVDYQFTMKDATDIMSKMCFNCGIEEEDGELPAHTVYLDNVVLEMVDDSKVDYEASKPYSPDIITNQVGFMPDSVKTAVIKTKSDTIFNIKDAATGNVVYIGNANLPTEDKLSKDMAVTVDFSELVKAGKYIITAEGLDDSYPFEVSDNIYDQLFDDSIRMLYLQRCGCKVEDEKFGHPTCHDSTAAIYHTNQKIDVTGGWHDAGDFGRYVVPAAKAVADLMYAYIEKPQMFNDKVGIPESGNKIPDVLDEVRYELEWMMKMQDATDGGVYHKVSCANFPGFIMPEDETGALIVMPKTVTSTADFAASMALAAEVYKEFDADFAKKCLESAKKAYTWAKANPGELYLANPADISTGAYEDKSAADEMYWAACQLYRATGETSYLADASNVQSGLDWALVGDYGNIALVTMKDIDKNSAAYKNAADTIIEQAKKFYATANSSAYGVALSKFNWGSNMTVANAGIILNYAYKLTGDKNYQKCLDKQLNYLLGCNANGASFFTGYGTVSPENPHHRPSIAQGEAMKGMLVGGVDQMLEDSAAKAYCADNAPAKCWIDHDQSYSTNEITIYWNSPLTYLIALASDGKSDTPAVTPPTIDPPVKDGKWGDANYDGEVSVADAAAILQYLGNSEKFQLPDEGKKLSDVCNSGDGITPKDALAIQKYMAKIINSLPESVSGGSAQPAVTTAAKTTAAPVTTTAAPVTTKAVTTAVANNIKDFGTPMNAGATAVEDFRDGKSDLFIASDGWENGDPFDCFWYEQNTSLENGMLTLTIDKDHSDKYNYSGAEYRTKKAYGYGYYETSMQAIKNNGVVSSFFTYTGPSEENPWDEIDIEILGKDTTKVQLNYYTNGKGNHEYMYDLGFDSSEGFHTYGFDWQPDHITWYVDGKAVYTAKDNIPKTPGRIMMNTWPGRGVDEWLNHYDGKTPLKAHYQWVTYDEKGKK